MNHDPNTEEYPRLIPPKVVYEGKAALKKTAVIPMYAKIISAAAAVALLVALFWRPSSRPELPLMAELSPMCSGSIETALSDQPLRLSGNRACFPVPARTASPQQVTSQKQVAPSKQTDLVLLSSLSPNPALALPSEESSQYLILPDITYAFAEVWTLPDEEEEDMSLARKGFQLITDGRYDKLGDFLRQGWRTMKGEMALMNHSVSDGITSLKNRER